MEEAYLIYGGTTYCARYRAEEGVALSAVVKLIQGIWQRDPKMARKILRSRIFSTAKATPMCRGMVRVAAKRMTELASPIDLSGAVDVGVFDPLAQAPVEPSVPCAGKGWMEAARELAARAQRGSARRFECDRPVGAVLLSEEGELLGWGINTNAANRTLHAEVNLVQRFCLGRKRRIPAGSTLYVSLRCCKMCAGMIWHCAEDPTALRVFYGENDSGSNARDTAIASIERIFDEVRADPRS